LRLAVEMGESHFREFKSALEGRPNGKRPREPREICTDVARTLVAFANADGGELFVGVEDDGEITGIPFEGADLELISRAHVTHVHAETPVPLTRSAVVAIDGKRVLYFATAKGSECVHVTSDGRCLQRRDRESVPRDPKRIQFSRRETESLEYDRALLTPPHSQTWTDNL
jgi:ATP-dependent DNA helicase RecG